MRNTMLIISNTLKVAFRKKGNILIYIFLPLTGVFLSLLLYSSTNTSMINVGFADRDAGVLSAGLRDALESAGNFNLSDISEGEINKKLLDSEIDAAVVIPAGFTDSAYDGEIMDVEIVSLKGQDTTLWVEQVINSHLNALSRISMASAGNRELFDRMNGRNGTNVIKMDVVRLEDKLVGKSITLKSVGFLIMFMMLGAGFTSMIILKEKRNRTYHRICSAPVSAGQYILANSLTSLLITVIQILAIQLVMKFVFRIDTGISDISMFIILLMFGLVAISLGLVITAYSNSSYMAGSLSTLIMVPSCMLGGCYWDIDFMPDFMQKISYFMPQRWAIDAVEKLQSGTGYAGIYMNLAILAAFALVLVLAATYKFSRTDNVQKFI